MFLIDSSSDVYSCNFFFFSSRRRHTRCLSDWSSDVCSSDLGRLTGWILCLLPVVMFFLINAANPGYADVLVHDPVGRKLTYAGIGMMAVGGLLIRKIVRIKV